MKTGKFYRNFAEKPCNNNNNNNNNNNTYLLTPWSRVLLEKLASLQLVKKFPALLWNPNNNNNNNTNSNNNNFLQLGCHPVAVVMLHVYKV